MISKTDIQRAELAARHIDIALDNLRQVRGLAPFAAAYRGQKSPVDALEAALENLDSWLAGHLFNHLHDGKDTRPLQECPNCDGPCLCGAALDDEELR